MQRRHVEAAILALVLIAIVVLTAYPAVVKYDPKITTHDKVRDAINGTGYTVKEGK